MKRAQSLDSLPYILAAIHIFRRHKPQLRSSKPSIIQSLRNWIIESWNVLVCSQHALISLWSLIWRIDSFFTAKFRVGGIIPDSNLQASDQLQAGQWWSFIAPSCRSRVIAILLLRNTGYDSLSPAFRCFCTQQTEYSPPFTLRAVTERTHIHSDFCFSIIAVEQCKTSFVLPAHCLALPPNSPCIHVGVVLMSGKSNNPEFWVLTRTPAISWIRMWQLESVSFHSRKSIETVVFWFSLEKSWWQHTNMFGHFLSIEKQSALKQELYQMQSFHEPAAVLYHSKSLFRTWFQTSPENFFVQRTSITK